MNSVHGTRAKGLAVLLATLGVLASAAYGVETPLANGVPVAGISGAAGSETFYRIDVPAGQDELEISTTGGTGDADLYVRRGSLPTTTSYDYRPYKPGNEEKVTVANPAAGTWFIMLRGYTAYAGVTLKATYSAAIVITPLTNSIPVTSLGAPEGTELYFSIDVPAGQTKLEISTSGGTGDADLYVKRGALPTTSSYDYRPFQFGNNETVAVNNPAADTWYIMIRAYNAFAGVTLLASYSGGIGTALENGVPVENLSGAAGSERIYRIDVPAGQINLEIKMSGGTGDADLFVKFGARPTISDYDYRPFLAGNDETVTVNNPTAGTWYIMIRGYSDYSGVTLKATYSDVFTLLDEVPVLNISGGLNSEKFYKIEVPSGQSTLLFNISGGTGNADLYVRRGAKPTTATWDYRAIQWGNTESINISSPQGGTWYVMLRGTQAYSGVTLEADYSFTGTSTLLFNGVPVPNISGAATSERFYRIEVSGGQTMLEIKISGGTGDADLYVKRGSPPTTSEYDYRPYLSGNNETVTVNNPTGGTWHIMIRGYQAYSGVTLVATYSGVAPPPPEVIVLSNGVPVTGIAGATGSEKFYKIDVPAGQAKLEIMMSGGTGDADLYVRRGSKPTSTEWDYRPYLVGNNETVTIDNPPAATYYIMLRAYAAYDSVTLKATYQPAPEPVTPLSNGVPVPGLSGTAGSEQFYKIDVPAGQEFLTIQISGGSGDADLYVRKGSKPTTSSWDYRPYLIGNNEKVDITNPAAATWYIMLRAYQTYSGVTLVATYGITPKGNNFASDPNCVALWRFESSKLTIDSIGTNTLTNEGVDANTTDYQEGTASARFQNIQGDQMYILDAALSSNFPLRTGDATRKISVACWFKLNSLDTGTGEAAGRTLFSKYDVNKMSFSLRVNNEGRVVAFMGITDGTSYKFFTDTSTVIVPGRWYHVAATFNDADGFYRLRIFNQNASTVTETTGTMNHKISAKDGTVRIGAHRNANQKWDGLIDEMAVFNDVLTLQEIDKIRQGTYGKP
jgi:hypothetical protein